MAGLRGKVILSASVFFFILGLLFTTVGYVTDWLVPREDRRGGILGIGLRLACFDNNFRFESTIDRSLRILDGCKDISKNSAIFSHLKDYTSPPNIENVGHYIVVVASWGPFKLGSLVIRLFSIKVLFGEGIVTYLLSWFQHVQDMHLASLLLCVFTFLFLVGFLVVYFFVKYQLRKRKRPSSAMLITKAGLAFWFILAFVICLLQIAEPAMFYHNYEQNRNQFFPSRNDNMDYGPGFGFTIASGLCLLASATLGGAMFCGIVLKMFRMAMDEGKEDFDSVEARSTEMERLSNEDSQSQTASRKGPEGQDKMEDFKSEPSRRSVHSIDATVDNEPQAYSNIPVRKSTEGRPIPAPRSSVASSREPSIQPSRETSVDRSDYQPREGRGDMRDVRYSTPSPARPSTLNTSGAYSQRSARAPSEGGSQYSYSSQPRSQYTGGYSPYDQQQPRYYQSPNSETESQRGERNRSVSRSSRGTDFYSRAPGDIPQPKVIKPKTPTDVKHSRYAAY